MEGPGETCGWVVEDTAVPSLASLCFFPPTGGQRPSTVHGWVVHPGSKPLAHPPGKAMGRKVERANNPKSVGGQVLQTAEGTNNELQRHPKRRRSSSTSLQSPLGLSKAAPKPQPSIWGQGTQGASRGQSKPLPAVQTKPCLGPLVQKEGQIPASLHGLRCRMRPAMGTT